MTVRVPNLTMRSTALAFRTEDELPTGVCGRVTGLALRYNVVDSYGTLFTPGSVEKTRAKVTAGKVKLFDNHGMQDYYGTRTHIGFVRSLTMAGDAELMVADLFDTEDGRRAKEYLSAVTASGAETGLSIGFYGRGGTDVRDSNGVWQHYAYSEIELDEISLAPRQAVPGALVANVRAEQDPKVLRALLTPLCARMSDADILTLLRETRAAAPAVPDADTGRDERPDNATVPATMDERLRAVRASYAHA